MPDCACTVYTNTELLVSPINLVIPSLVHVNKAIIVYFLCTCFFIFFLFFIFYFLC